jgi:hypothetical protein
VIRPGRHDRSRRTRKGHAAAVIGDGPFEDLIDLRGTETKFRQWDRLAEAIADPFADVLKGQKPASASTFREHVDRGHWPPRREEGGNRRIIDSPRSQSKPDEGFIVALAEHVGGIHGFILAGPGLDRESQSVWIHFSRSTNDRIGTPGGQFVPRGQPNSIE